MAFKFDNKLVLIKDILEIHWKCGQVFGPSKAFFNEISPVKKHLAPPKAHPYLFCITDKTEKQNWASFIKLFTMRI